MTEPSTILFRTPQAALVFAFNYSMQQQGRPLADRMASPAARTGKGLSGNDGAGQAGMIRGELKALTEVELAILIARFAPQSTPCSCRNPCCSGRRMNQEWSDAIRVLEQAALTQLSGHVSNYRLRRRLVEKAVGVKIELKAIAKESGVSEKTVAAHWKIIKEWTGGRPKQKSSKPPGRIISDEANVSADPDDDASPVAAIDGLESSARKRADTILSLLSFVGIETEIS